MTLINNTSILTPKTGVPILPNTSNVSKIRTPDHASGSEVLKIVSLIAKRSLLTACYLAHLTSLIDRKIDHILSNKNLKTLGATFLVGVAIGVMCVAFYTFPAATLSFSFLAAYFIFLSTLYSSLKSQQRKNQEEANNLLTEQSLKEDNEQVVRKLKEDIALKINQLNEISRRIDCMVSTLRTYRSWIIEHLKIVNKEKSEKSEKSEESKEIVQLNKLTERCLDLLSNYPDLTPSNNNTSADVSRKLKDCQEHHRQLLILFDAMLQKLDEIEKSYVIEKKKLEKGCTNLGILLPE